MRIFVSTGWSTVILDSLENLQHQLRTEGVKGYWRARNNLHLTLKFLGEVENQKIEEIIMALEKAGRGVKPFDVRLHGLGAFPNLREPRILWVGIESLELLTLQRSVEQELANIGFSPENRRFRPHVTIASGGIAGISPSLLQKRNALNLGDKITHFELMHSVVEQGIRKYTSLAYINL